MSIHYRQHGSAIILLGNTYPYREQIKALGGRFDGAAKNWRLPASPENLAKIEELCAELGGGRLGDAVPVTPVAPALAVTAPTGAAKRDFGLSIRQLMERAHAAVSGAFPLPVWVTGEVQNLAIKAGGVFFDLAEGVEKGHANATATVRAIIWSGNLQALRSRHGAEPLADVLKEGLQIRCLVQVQFYKERGSLSVIVEDVDPAFTKGALALAREQLLKDLRRLGLDQANKRLSLTPFPLLIGLISAEGSRAHSDFADQLREMQYPGRVLFAPAAMQGESTVPQVVAALAKLDAAGVDLIVLTRGGGSAADLRWFDAAEIAYAIAKCSVPVIAAIGHHEDICVAEEICHLRQKTPTAAADFVAGLCQNTRLAIDQLAAAIARALSSRIEDGSRTLASLHERLAQSATRGLDTRQATLQTRGHDLHAAVSERLHAWSLRLTQLGPGLGALAAEACARHREQLLNLEMQLGQKDPQPWLKQGWTQLRAASGLLRSVDAVDVGVELTAFLSDGWVNMKILAKGKRRRRDALQPEKEQS